MKVAIGSDHAGFEEKEKLKKTLEEIGVEYEDLGTNSVDSVDYPDFAQRVGEAVAGGKAEQGILVCGSGIGVAMAANKIRGVRAAQAWNESRSNLRPVPGKAYAMMSRTASARPRTARIATAPSRVQVVRVGASAPRPGSPGARAVKGSWPPGRTC